MSNVASTLRRLALGAGVASLAACGTHAGNGLMPLPNTNVSPLAPKPDPRVGLRAGRYDAQQAFWNMRLVSSTPAQGSFNGVTNSDLAFLGKYAIQGNYNGYQVWDISDPAHPTLTTSYLCPASQSDVSVYKNLLFVSGEGLSGRIDCGAQGVHDTVSADRLRGVRIFDITDIAHPRNVGNVQTCRGSHTHSVLVDPKDPDNVYVYISGQAGVRSPNELAGCSSMSPDQDPNSALFRIEVIKVPLAHPEQAAIVSSPRIFQDLAPPPTHGDSPADVQARAAAVAAAKARGGFTYVINGVENVLPPQFGERLLDSIVKQRGGTGAAAATAADSANLRAGLQPMIDKMVGAGPGRKPTGPNQCHDITLDPSIGFAGGACGGYGLLLDIRDPMHPVRLDAVSDSNFSYWHSATFNNDGTKLLFSDEWGGGGQPKCRATDRREWGGDAIFTINNGKLTFQSYYKMPAPQTVNETCVAHNGSLIPIPGRDVMVQSWYQGGISVFDWTDAAHPVEIAFFDRGPADSTRMAAGGTWSAYWYNGSIVSSEIDRGLDILSLTPSAFLTQNEIDAANTVHLDYLNVQGQPHYTWPASFALSRAYLDQLERNGGLAKGKIASARSALASAERLSGDARAQALHTLGRQLDADTAGAKDSAKVHTLAQSVHQLAMAM